MLLCNVITADNCLSRAAVLSLPTGWRTFLTASIYQTKKKTWWTCQSAGSVLREGVASDGEEETLAGEQVFCFYVHD